MEHFGPGGRSIAHNPPIVGQYPQRLSQAIRVRPLIASQIQKIHLKSIMQLRAVHLIAADEVQRDALCDERRREAEGVGLVPAAGEQPHFGTRPGALGARATFSRLPARLPPAFLVPGVADPRNTLVFVDSHFPAPPGKGFAAACNWPNTAFNTSSTLMAAVARSSYPRW